MKNWIYATTFCAVALAGCGGGGNDNAIAGIDARGTPSVAIVSKGTITGFGSIIVNDVRFDTANATFDIDGSAGSQSDLSTGDVVIVRGTLDASGTTGTANSVAANDLVEGPIAAIDAVAGTLTVLGQTVRTDADTSFDDSISPASLDGLAVGDVVEVAGFVLADGSIGATRIELKPAGGEFEVTGLVSNLGATTFDINSLTVDFSSAQLDDFPGGAPEEGQLVEAKGTSLGAGGELLATRVEFKGNDLDADEDVEIELEGFITRFVSATDFDVEGVPVTTSGATQFENGTAADLALNRKVEVEGNFNASGVLVADKVELKQAGFLRVEGLVGAVGADTVTIFGIDILINSGTRLEDKSSANLESFSIADINVGDYLETRAFENSDGVVATLVERDDFDNEVAIRAFVDSVSDPNLVIRGVNVFTNGATVFRDQNDAVITAAAFFAVAEGRLVEASGTLLNGGILAEEVELED